MAVVSPCCRTVLVMTRAEVLCDLMGNGRHYETSRLAQLAAELRLPVADVLVVAGHPVPGDLLPPDRDKEIMREFVYRVTFCKHPQLAVLRDFLSALPNERTAPEPWPARDPAAPDPFPGILNGLMHNRGFGVREFPFVVLSQSTIRGMLGGAWHHLAQLHKVAGPLGWRTEDLATLAGEPLQPLNFSPLFCRHLGEVFVAATPCTTEQLVLAAREADRLSQRKNHGAWHPASEGIDDCPDV
jgi:hypothetical protein